jgi:hypothetical protein
MKCITHFPNILELPDHLIDKKRQICFNCSVGIDDIIFWRQKPNWESMKQISTSWWKDRLEKLSPEAQASFKKHYNKLFMEIYEK